MRGFKIYDVFSFWWCIQGSFISSVKNGACTTSVTLENLFNSEAMLRAG